jgi:large subunit ribosomal protein L10
VDRSQKKEQVSALSLVFADAKVVVVTQNNGLTVAQVTELRRQMREAGASFKVAKNRLVCLALEGTPYKPLAGMFKGPTGIAYANDPVAAAKVAVEFAKKHDKFVVVGGAMGDTVLNAEGVKTLASLPSLDELRGKLVGLLQAPATKVAGVIQAPAAQLARLMQAFASKE